MGKHGASDVVVLKRICNDKFAYLEMYLMYLVIINLQCLKLRLFAVMLGTRLLSNQSMDPRLHLEPSNTVKWQP